MRKTIAVATASHRAAVVVAVVVVVFELIRCNLALDPCINNMISSR